LVFPFFIFIVGVSMVLSFNSRREKGATRTDLARHVLKRSAIIFLLGVFLNAYPQFDVHTTRVLGVLQRIAIVYVLTAALLLYAGRKASIVTMVLVLFGYWLIMTTVPVPGYGPGVLTMGGSLATYVDRTLLYNHLYIPHSFDPEGLLSTFPAVATCLIGVFVGEWVREKSNKGLVFSLLIASLIGIALGWIWSMWFPINKQLWTSSYVLFTAGAAMATFAICYWLVDVIGWRSWAIPFIWFGVNSLAIYFFAELLYRVLIYHSLRGVRIKEIVYQSLCVHVFTRPDNNSLVFALGYLCLFAVIAWLMYEKRIMIRV
jgi:predicted acyltransferase